MLLKQIRGCKKKKSKGGSEKNQRGARKKKFCVLHGKHMKLTISIFNSYILYKINFQCGNVSFKGLWCPTGRRPPKAVPVSAYRPLGSFPSVGGVLFVDFIYIFFYVQ